MSRLSPSEQSAYRKRIAAAQTVPAILAVINEAAAAARRPAPAAPVSARKPTAARLITGAVPASMVTTPVPAVVPAKEDGSDIVALARSAGLAGMSPQPTSETPPSSSPLARSDDIVSLARAVGLAGFKRQDEESSQ